MLSHPKTLEQLKLNGEGEYNINVLKEVEVTESYLGLNVDVTHCQNIETLEECETRSYVDTIKHKCNCLPFNIWTSTKAKFD